VAFDHFYHGSFEEMGCTWTLTQMRKRWVCFGAVNGSVKKGGNDFFSPFHKHVEKKMLGGSYTQWKTAKIKIQSQKVYSGREKVKTSLNIQIIRVQVDFQ
jgi:hypothetical protein